MSIKDECSHHAWSTLSAVNNAKAMCKMIRSDEPHKGEPMDINFNHGCMACEPDRCGCFVGPPPMRNHIICCPRRPSAIKVLTKLLLFMLVISGIVYSLYRVAAAWSLRHEILTLLLLLLATRLVCRKNWFLPSQYWRNLEPMSNEEEQLCYGERPTPRQIDINVPTKCSLGF